MFFWVAKQVVISLVMILLFHQIILFITKTFTKPKVIDLVDKPTEMYEDIYETINSSSLLPPSNIPTGIPQEEKDSMQMELQEYLTDLTKQKEQTTDLDTKNKNKNTELKDTAIESNTEKS